MNYDQEPLKFIYRKEYWFANAFFNTVIMNPEEIIIKLRKELIKLYQDTVESPWRQSIFQQEVENASWDDTFLNELIYISKHITLQMKWLPSLRGFPFKNGKALFNQAGWIEFEVEYFKDNTEEKRTLRPWILHEFPVYVIHCLKKILKNIDLYEGEVTEIKAPPKNFEFIYLDEDSLYVTTICDKIEGLGVKPEFRWEPISIMQHKKSIYHWIVPYSGRWESFDVQEEAVNQQLQKNLSYKTTELSYIQSGSAFLYIQQKDFDKFFDLYYKKTLVDTVGAIRSLKFAMMELSISLDDLVTSMNTSAQMQVQSIQNQIAEHEFLVGKIDAKISELYNELEVNRSGYYKKILHHLMQIFNIEGISEWLHTKLDKLSKSLENRYHQIQEQDQKSIQKSTFLLEILFGLSLFVDLVLLAFSYFEARRNNWITESYLSAIVGFIILIFASIIVIYILTNYAKKSGKSILRETVDGVIIHSEIVGKDGRETYDDFVVLVERKFPPFQGQLALPGGFIELGEAKLEALEREMWEETGLEVKKARFIKLFDDPNRDPRGKIVSHAYLCEVKSLDGLRPSTDVVSVVKKSLTEIEQIDLAFDHNNIIRCAKKMYEKIKKEKTKK
ncbi:MAG: NUDIX hydrolase [Candidatus Lokiarchaeota archaeon]|nr:NUDIX hydrolase [Candidatus Lokiarchaeota archaeon]